MHDLAFIKTIAGVVNHMHTFTRDLPGLVNGGIYCGPLWPEDDRTPLLTKEGFEHRMNAGLTESFGKFAVATTPLVFTHCDISARNLLFDDYSIWLLDWEFAGYFPRSAEIATLRLDVGKECANLDFYRDLEYAILEEKPLAPQESEQLECWREFVLNHVRAYR